MLNKSIAYRLKTYISVAVIGVFIFFMLIFHTIINKKIDENITNKAKGLTSEVTQKVRRQLVTTSEVASNIANQILFYAQHNHPDQLIVGIMEKYPFLNSIQISIDSVATDLKYHNFYAFRDSNNIQFQSGNSKIYGCQYERLMIQEVVKTKKPGWTDVLKCPKNSEPVTSFYSPVYEQSDDMNPIIGQVICELSLVELNNFINNINIPGNGYAFLLSKEGRYLTHPIEEWVFTRSVTAIPDNVYDKKKFDIFEILEKGLEGSVITYPESRDFQKHWTYFTPIEETKWTLIISIPHEELFGSLYMSILTMILIAVTGILIIYITINYLANKLVEPLTSATEKLRKFASQSGYRFSTTNEVRLVSESLDFLQSWYEKFKINQTMEEKESHKQMQDLLEAAEIQQGLISSAFNNLPKKEEISINTIYHPARIVSGDLFDLFFLDDDNLVFTMGDVSGKGVSAAFFMSIAQTIIKSNAKFKNSNTIVRKANDELYTNNQHQFFLTLFLGVFNVKTGILDFCNAAHTPAYILKINGEIEELSQSHGLPLGLYSNKPYNHSRIKIDTGDSIILYTDGITELQNEKRIHFGAERFVENLRHLVGTEPEKMVERISKSLRIFQGEAEQADDISLMVIKYNDTKKPDN